VAGKGGRRPGAGRPTAAAVAARSQAPEAEEFVEGARALLPEALETLKLLGMGIWVQGCAKCRKCVEDCVCLEPASVRIYRKPPDRQALEILVEHGRGRAAQVQQQAAETQIIVQSAIPRPPARGAK